MKKSQVVLSCLGTTIGTVLIGVQPVLGLTWVLTADAAFPLPIGNQPGCCSGSFDFDGLNYTNVNIVANILSFTETFSAITYLTPLTATTESQSNNSTVNVTFDVFLDPSSPAGTIITFSGMGTAFGVDMTLNGTVTAQPVPVPYEFESLTGLAILGAGYGLNKLRKRGKQQRTSQTQTPDQQLTSDNSQSSEITQNLELASLAEKP